MGVVIISPTCPKEEEKCRVGFRKGMRTEEGHLGRGWQIRGAEGGLSAGPSWRVAGYYNG